MGYTSSKTWNKNEVAKCVIHDYPENSPSYDYDNSFQPSFSASYTRLWNVTPNFFQKKAKKQRIDPLEYYYYHDKLVDPSGSFSVRHSPFTGHISTQDGIMHPAIVGAAYWNTPYFEMMPKSDVPGFIDSNLSNELLNKVKSESVNLSQVFAERHLTSDLIAGTATKIAKSITAIKHGNLPLALSHLGAAAPSKSLLKKFKANSSSLDKKVSQTWLEIQYGWKPLLSDVYNSAQFLAELNSSREIVKTVSVYKTVGDIKSTVQYCGLDSGVKVDIDFVSSIKMKRSVTYRITNQAAKDLASAGILNPLELAWELTPYSFVVDWFYPLGNFISTFDATAGCEFISGTSSCKMKSQVLCSAAGLGSGPAARYFGSASSSREGIYVARIPLMSFPSPSLPQLKNPLGFDHVTNALALLNLAIKR